MRERFITLIAIVWLFATPDAWAIPTQSIHLSPAPDMNTVAKCYLTDDSLVMEVELGDPLFTPWPQCIFVLEGTPPLEKKVVRLHEYSGFRDLYDPKKDGFWLDGENYPLIFSVIKKAPDWYGSWYWSFPADLRPIFITKAESDWEEWVRPPHVLRFERELTKDQSVQTFFPLYLIPKEVIKQLRAGKAFIAVGMWDLECFGVADQTRT